VTGPPGAGKTTVVSAWLEVREIDGIWYQVDPGDADLASFFHYLGVAAVPFARKGEAPLPALTPEYLPDLRGFSRRFFRLLFERLPAEATLVLDNYQEVPPGELYHELVAEAIGEVPSGACLLVISRRDAPEPYARLIANERVSRVDWADLRLSPEEADAIGRARGVGNLAHLHELKEQADGWAAGLTLLLERCKTSAHVPVRQGQPQEVLFDYFASQVFDAVDLKLQDFLLKTALPRIVQVAVANALTGHANAEGVLDDLCQRGLFVHRRPGDPASYQYHALVRDFLNGRLKQQLPSAGLNELLARTADLLTAHGQPEDAVALYCQGRAWGNAERLMVELAPRLLAEGRWRTLQEWLGLLPGEQLSASPRGLYWLGLSQMHSTPVRAREWLVRANDLFKREGGVIGEMLSAAAIIRSYHFEYNTFEAMDPWIEQLEANLSRSPEFPTPADELSVHSAVLLVVTYRLPGHAMREASLRRASNLLDAPIDINQKVSAAFVLLLAHTMAHENDSALHVIARIERLIDDGCLTTLNRAYWWMLVGYLQHRRGDRAATQEALNLSDKIATENGLRQPEFLSRCFRAQHCCSWSDIEGAVQALNGLDKFVSDTKPMATAQYHKQCFFLEMARGNAAAADSHARRGVMAAACLGAPVLEVAWMSQGAAALAMNGAYEHAGQWLDAAWRLSDNGFAKTYRPMILASRAYTALCQGKQDEARSLIRELFALTPDANAFSYIGTVPVVKDVVLREALANGICVPLVRTLIRKYELAPTAVDLDGWPWPVQVYTLGEFRIEVDGQPARFSRKTPRKTLLLLKALIAMGGRSVPQRRLVDAVWPDEDGGAGVEALGASLHRLRKLLVHTNAIEFAEGLLSINRAKVWVDLWSLEQQLAPPGHTQDAEETGLRRVFGLYRGRFLDDDLEAPWAITPRERVHSRFLRYLLVAASRLEAAGRFDAAATLYRMGIDVDELAEDLYQGLMRSLKASGHPAEALTVFRRLREVFGKTLGISPSAGSRRLFEEIQQQD